MTDRVHPHVYATYFDSGYLARGLTLIESLRSNGDHSPVVVLCLDQAAKDYLDALGDPTIRTMTVETIEAAEPRLRPLKSSRSRMEYYFTCTPLMVRTLMREQIDPEAVVIYLDADLYFFDDPAIALEAMGSGSVGIIEHRYTERLARRLNKYGRFNVGWVGFRNDANGTACLDWWAESCLDWCSDTPEDGKYADQGYLDSFPTLFDGVVIMSGAGLDLAPWNTGRHPLTTHQLGASAPSVLVDGADPLVFFHFHGIRRSGPWFVTSQLIYRSRMRAILRECVYVPYLARLEAMTDLVKRTGGVPIASVSKRGTGIRGTIFSLQRLLIDRVSIATGNAVRAADLDSSAV